MRWAEVDLDAKVWTVPAARMKAGREHRVPLSGAAMAVLQGAARQQGVDLVFPGTKGQPLSDMSLTAVMRRLKVDAVPHGMRSSFRDWTAEHTHFPNEVAEMALAHVVGDKVEAAYRRGDLFEKRYGQSHPCRKGEREFATRGQRKPHERNRAQVSVRLWPV
jgi:integrase